MTMSPSRLQADELIDQYRIIKLLNQGGMAEVFLAEDTALNRHVALKVLLPQMAANEKIVQRFLLEAEAIAALDSPFVISVFSTGRLPDTRPYLALDYIKSGSLEDYLAGRSEQLALGEALQILLQIAKGLEEIHRHDIVHRDLKPANILRHSNGSIVITDLGVASVRPENNAPRLTRLGVKIGTPGYMAPETEVDKRSDIYACGIILFELLTGERHGEIQAQLSETAVWRRLIQLPIIRFLEPWFLSLAKSINITRQIKHRLLTKRPGIEPYKRTLAILYNCLQEDPQRRYQSTIQLQAGVTEALTEANNLPARWPHSRWFLLLLPVLLFLIIRIGLIAEPPLLLPTITNSPPATSIVTASALTIDTARVNPTSTLRPTFTPSLTAVPTLTPTMASTEMPTATPILTVFAEGLLAYNCVQDGEQKIYLNTPNGRYPFLLPGQLSESYLPTFDPMGVQLSFISPDTGSWQIYAINLDGQNLLSLTQPVPGNNLEMAWSPDGQQIVYVSEANNTRQLYIMNRDGSNPQQLTAIQAYNDDPAWSVTNEIAFESDVTGRVNIYIVSPVGGIPELFMDIGDANSTPAWSPDGHWLAFESRIGDDRQIWVASRDKQIVQQITFKGNDNRRPVWSPDGRSLVFQSNYLQENEDSFDIWTIALATQTLRRITTAGNCENPTWSPANLVLSNMHIDEATMTDVYQLDPLVVETSQIEALRRTIPPTIDGIFNEWGNEPIYISSHIVYQDKSWDNSDDLKATWQLAWDDSYLYVAVTVEDDIHVQTQTGNQIYRGDSLELQFDINLAEDYGPGLSPDDFQVTLSPGNLTTLAPSASLAQGTEQGRILNAPNGHHIIVAAEPTINGYHLEAAIPWSDLSASPIQGLTIGLALNVNDNDQPGQAIQELQKSTAPTRTLTDPTSWGTLTLK